MIFTFHFENYCCVRNLCALFTTKSLRGLVENLFIGFEMSRKSFNLFNNLVDAFFFTALEKLPYFRRKLRVLGEGTLSFVPEWNILLPEIRLEIGEYKCRCLNPFWM